MATSTREIATTPERVWSVLSDGWLYPLWVVGATRMRDVDRSWPDVGARLHHSAGTWPLTVDDSTEVVACDPGRFLRLRARGWPVGEAEVALTLRPAGSGTQVELVEHTVRGPGRLVPQVVEAPTIRFRNRESLRRLAFVAENRAAPTRRAGAARDRG